MATELDAWYQPLMSATLAVADLNEHAAHVHSVRDRTSELVGLAVGIALNSATNGVIDPVCAAGHRNASGRTFPVGLLIRKSMVRIVADGLVAGRVAHNQNPPQGVCFQQITNEVAIAAHILPIAAIVCQALPNLSIRCRRLRKRI